MLLILQSCRVDDIRLHDIFNHIIVVMKEKILNRYHAEKHTVVIHDVAGIDRLLIHTGTPDSCKSILHGSYLSGDPHTPLSSCFRAESFGY